MKFTLTLAQYHAALAKLLNEPAASVSLGTSGNSGSVAGDGVSIVFAYDGSSTLTATVAGKPWWMPESAVTSAISGFFGS